jgi:hypothetical protein
MDWKFVHVRHYGLEVCASEALWMKLRESVYVTGYLACHIARHGILDKQILGEALSRVEGLYKGIPHYLPFKNQA